MKLFITVSSLLFATLTATQSFAQNLNSKNITCPNTELGETDLDCPWAAAARSLNEAHLAGKDLQVELTTLLPKLTKQMEDESRSASGPLLLKSWGNSLNFDEYANGIVVLPELLDTLLSVFSFPARRELIVHAGIEHTYGYLFSLLKTPFGYKRARWVQNDIEIGFGLSNGLLGPTPPQGSFLKNVSVFAQSIAFRNENQGAIQGAAPELQNFAYTSLSPVRLLETVLIPNADGSAMVAIDLRTDLIPFPQQPTVKPNTHLLIYSIRDERLGYPQLISLFPVSTAFVQTALSPDGLGEGKPVFTRYNASVEGLTGVTPQFTGSRKIVTR